MTAAMEPRCTALPGGGALVTAAPRPAETAVLAHVEIDRVARQRFLELVANANRLRSTMEAVAATPEAISQAEVGLSQIIQLAEEALSALRKASS
ncbi:MAG: hypothetical protein HY859_06795 [Caulobacterales bacterium]|nr:hypothetical protein [Caulobacterales bacterium]